MNDFFKLLVALQDFLSQWVYYFAMQNTIGFVCIVLILHSLVIKANHHSLLGAWSVNLLGVFFHELSHAIVGKLLFTRPVNFIVIPEKHRTEDGKIFYSLGRVTHSKMNFFNAFPSAMAPLLLLFIAYAIQQYYWVIVPDRNLFYLILYVYLLVVFILNSIPSSIDFNVAFNSSMGLVLWTCIIIYSGIYFNR